MRLNEVQAQFKDLLLSPATALENPVAEFAGLFANDDLSARLKIYRNNVMTSLSTALTANFPLLEKLAGKEFLSTTARAYIMKHPPENGYLGSYGSGFADFIENSEAARNFPWLADIARLEIFINLSEHAQDDMPLTAADMAQISPEALENFHLKVRNSVFFLKSRWPLLKIREFCLDNDLKPPVLETSDVFLIIYRTDYPGMDVKFINLTENEYEFMKKLEIMPLGPALEETLGAYPDFDFQTTLQRHITLQTFLKPGKAE